MKKLNKLQEFVQEKCVMAAHPECETLDEALEKELLSGCYIISKRGVLSQVLTKEEPSNAIRFLENIDDQWVLNERWFTIPSFLTKYCKIIGLPPTLSRVLNAVFVNSLPPRSFDSSANTYKFSVQEAANSDSVMMSIHELIRKNWNELKESGEDAVFWDQSEETQKVIAEALGFIGEEE